MAYGIGGTLHLGGGKHAAAASDVTEALRTTQPGQSGIVAMQIAPHSFNTLVDVVKAMLRESNNHRDFSAAKVFVDLGHVVNDPS